MKTLQEIANGLIQQIRAERVSYDAGSLGMIKGVQVLVEAIEKEIANGNNNQTGAEGDSTEKQSADLPATEVPAQGQPSHPGC